MGTADTSRKFLLRDASGRNVDVDVVLERIGSNRSPTFSFRHSGGDLASAVERSPDVAEDLLLLRKVSGRLDPDGPMHAVANAVYHLSRGELGSAVACVEAGTSEGLSKAWGEAEARIVKELAGTVDADLAALVKMTKEIAASMATSDDTGRGFAARNRASEAAKETVRRASILFGVKVDPARPSQVLQGTSTRDALVSRFRATCRREAVEAYVDAVCRPVWQAEAQAAKVALSRPDFRSDTRPVATEDPTTFEGFLRTNGLAFGSRYTGRDDKTGATYWTCTLSKPGHPDVAVRFTQGSAYKDRPDAARLLESLQTDFASFVDDVDEWIESTGGEVGTVKELRAREAMHATVRRQMSAFSDMVGEDEAKRFLTEVGDDPPLVHEPDAPVP